MRASSILERLAQHDPNYVICGSIRRGHTLVGDIDIVTTCNITQQIVAEFDSGGAWQRVDVPFNYLAGCRLVSDSLGMKIDFWVVYGPPIWGGCVAYATGPREFNFLIEEFLGKEIWWSQGAQSEEQFFQGIGLAWVPPEDRGKPEVLEKVRRHLLSTKKENHSDEIPY